MTTLLKGAERTAAARDLATRYRAGQSIRTIAADLGRSYCYVRHLLVQAGVQFRNRGGNNNPKGHR